MLQMLLIPVTFDVDVLLARFLERVTQLDCYILDRDVIQHSQSRKILQLFPLCVFTVVKWVIVHVWMALYLENHISVQMLLQLLA